MASAAARKTDCPSQRLKVKIVEDTEQKTSKPSKVLKLGGKNGRTTQNGSARFLHSNSNPRC